MTGMDIGSRVRHAREQRGLSLSDAARLTKLSPIVLRAIERNDFDSLPAGMYRKAYLRTVATEVGLDSFQIAAEFDRYYGAPLEPEIQSETARKRSIADLVLSERPRLTAVAVFALLAMAWFVWQPVEVPTSSFNRPQSESERSAGARPMEAPGTAVPQSDPPGGVRVVPAVTSPVDVIKIDLTTVGWCWVDAESDGERMVYGLIEPGKRIQIRGRSSVALRLGDGGAVRLSINDGPTEHPGTAGEVVELEVTSDDLQSSAGTSGGET